MVRQAASQTRFRALKHEHGIAGRTTIIVRVIACFQHLQNCQGMVTAEELQTTPQFPACISRNSDRMALVQLEQNYGLPYFDPSVLAADVAFQKQPNSDVCGGLNEFFKLPPPNWNISCPNENQCLKDSQNAPPQGLKVSDKPIDASQKRFLIFDRSGNQTRLFFSPSFSPENQVVTSTTPPSANVLCEKVPLVDEQFLLNPIVEEKWDENHLNDGEGETFDDSEGIDALLYSDSDYEYDDDDENDEVTSARHDAPSRIEEGYDYKDKLFHELMEEVASCDGSSKRQRLLDGGYKKSSFVSFESPVNRASSFNYKDDDDESSYIGDISSYDDIVSSTTDKKVKIRETLKILASMIPGLESKDPMAIIEKAIGHFESMKIEAEALGFTLTGSFGPGQENH